MSLEFLIANVLKSTRENFKLKSTNKKYEQDNFATEWKSSRAEKHNKRLVNAEKVFALSPKEALSYEKLAIKLTSGLARGRAGNCVEMAAVAAFQAVKKGIDENNVFIVKMNFDHAFCLVTIMGKQLQPMKVDSLVTFSSSRDAAGVFIIDPWLNLAVKAESYPKEVKLKLGKWTAHGKRILCSDGQKTIWAVPNGDYMENLIGSGFEIISFT